MYKLPLYSSLTDDAPLGKEEHAEIIRTSSTKSVDSVMSFESDDLSEDRVYQMAPYELFGEAAGVGRVRVVKKGDILPLTTGYKAKKDGTAEVGVKFR